MKRNVSTLNLIVLICTYPRIILKFIRSHLSGIQTYDICLFTGAPSVPKNAIFKTWDPTRCWQNSNLFDDSWQLSSRQFRGLLKEMESAIGFQGRNRSSVLVLLITFLRNILFRSNTSSSDVTHQQWCEACKYQNIGKLSSSRTSKQAYPNRVVQEKRFEVSRASTTSRVVTL